MNLGLTGRRALVSGSNNGLGRAAAEELAAEGVDLILCARDKADLTPTAKGSTAEHGVRVESVAANLSTNEGRKQVLEGEETALGGVDNAVVINGGPPAGLFESHEASAWRSAYEQLVSSAVELIRGNLGTSRGHLSDPGHPEVQAALHGAAQRLAALAAKVEDALRFRGWGYGFVAGGTNLGLLTAGARALRARMSRAEDA